MNFLQNKLEATVRHVSKDQNVLMANNYLDNFETTCIQRSFCEVASMSRDIHYSETDKYTAKVAVQ